MHCRFVLCVALIAITAACTNPDAANPSTTNEHVKKIAELASSISELAKAIASRDVIPQKAEKAETNTEAPATPETNAKKESVVTLDALFSKDGPALLLKVANQAHGIEELAMLFQHLAGTSDEAKFMSVVDAVLPAESKHHILARAFYASLAAHDARRMLALHQIVVALDDWQKKQIVGYMLFVNSSHRDADFRKDILAEAQALGLDKRIFDHIANDVSDLKATLDAVVIGQESAKVALAVAIRNHYQRLEKGLKKSNILVLGPSGTGKTLMVQTIAESLDVPFTVADASSITQAGYIGGKVKDAVSALAQKADYDLDQIERGIIFFDEIDKMAARSGRADSEEFKRQAQATLLKVIEGIELEIPMGDKENKMTVNTSKILFVCAGAFTGLPEIISARLKRDNKNISDDIFAQVATEDLIAYGITPELLGRLPNLLTLRELNIDDLTRILKNPKSSILEEYKTLFKLQNVELQFTDEAILAIADKASEFKIGARALRTVVEHVMADLQFRLGHMGDIQSCTVTERVVRYNDLPILIYRSPEEASWSKQLLALPSSSSHP